MLTAPYSNEMNMYSQHHQNYHAPQMDLGNYDALYEHSGAANTGGNTHRLLEAIE